jgi:hypothetical protein
MDVADITDRHDHPAWLTAAGTFAAYGLILVAMTLLLFGLPWLIFAALP